MKLAIDIGLTSSTPVIIAVREVADGFSPFDAHRYLEEQYKPSFNPYFTTHESEMSAAAHVYFDLLREAELRCGRVVCLP